MTEDYTIEKALIDAHNPIWVFDNDLDIWSRVWCLGDIQNQSRKSLESAGGFAVGRLDKQWHIWHWPIKGVGWQKLPSSFDDIMRFLSDPEYQQRYGITP